MLFSHTNTNTMSEHKFKLLSSIKSDGRTLFYIEHETHGLQIARIIPKYLKTTAQYILYTDELIIEIVYPNLIEKFGLCIDQIDYINQQIYVCWKGQHWIYGDDHNFHQIIFPVEIIKTLGNYFVGANYLFALGIDNQLYMCKIPDKTHDNTPINCDLVAELCNTDANILDISFYCRMFINSRGQLCEFVLKTTNLLLLVICHIKCHLSNLETMLLYQTMMKIFTKLLEHHMKLT